MEWNIRESEQGSAGMWEVLFRIGSAKGTDLQVQQCDKKVAGNQKCMAGQLMLHVTEQSSIYMENMWFWVADHNIEDRAGSQINVYVARGVLINSRGPSWVYGTSNEHSSLYQWQLAGAEDIYLGMIQSETAYYEAGQSKATDLYSPGQAPDIPGDPDFSHCPKTNGKDVCNVGYALRIIELSKRVYVFGGGFYRYDSSRSRTRLTERSFFQDYKTDCANRGPGESCQDRIVDVDFSGPVYLFGIVSIGAAEVISPQGTQLEVKNVTRIRTINGYATAASWLLSSQGLRIGGTRRSLGRPQRYKPLSKATAPCAGAEKVRSWTDWDGSDLDAPCLVKPLMVACKDTLEKSLERHREMGDYEKWRVAYREMMRDYAADEMRKFVDDKMLNGTDGLRLFKCTWSELGRAATDHSCKIDDLPFQSGKLRFTLADEEGFYDELNKTHKISKHMVSFSEKPRIVLHAEGMGMETAQDPEDDWARPQAQKGNEGTGLAKQELFGLPMGNKDLEVDNPMLEFKNITHLLADKLGHLLDHHILEYDYYFDGYPAKDIAYCLCHLPVHLWELADHIDDVIRTGAKYEKEVLELRRRRERLHKILDSIELATGIIFIVGMAFSGAGGGLAAWAARGASAGAQLGTRLPPQFFQLTAQMTAQMTVRGGSLLQTAGTAFDGAAIAGLAMGGAPLVGMITKEFPDDAKDVLLDFFAALLVPAGLMAMTRGGGRLLPAGERGARGEIPGSFDMMSEAGPLALRIKEQITKQCANVAVCERMGRMETKLNGWGMCKPKG